MKKIGFWLTGAKIHDDGNRRQEAYCPIHIEYMAALMIENRESKIENCLIPQGAPQETALILRGNSALPQKITGVLLPVSHFLSSHDTTEGGTFCVRPV